LPGELCSATITVVPEEMGIYRGEVSTIMIALADIHVELKGIRRLLETTMAKRKRSKKEISEQARREAEKDPVVRELRRHAARIREELAAKGRGEGSA
jgi:hypothetical protein